MFSLIFTSCLQQNESSVENKEVIVDPPIQNSNIEQYDIEEVAEVYQELSVPVNHLSIGPDDSGKDRGLLPPPSHEKREHIKKLLKGLLEGPCPKNADEIFSRIIDGLQRRIEHLSDLLAKASDNNVIEKLKNRIEVLEELEVKLEEKKDECAAGTAECSEKFKEHIEKRIAEVSKVITELESKIAAEQNAVKKEYLERLLERMKSLKAHLEEVLAKC